MTVIIVDDEPKAIELIRSYLSHFSNFELVKTFRNGLKALEFLNSNPVDVVFLDINMPHLSGLSLSKMISPHTAIVFTTAYSEHAVESYSIDALDYLLKPISLERFSKTMTKLNTRFLTPDDPVIEASPQTIFIKSGVETHQLLLKTIEYLKKDGNYMYYFTSTQKIMTRQSIGEALAILGQDFIQVQKSFIVNFKKINSITSEYITIGSKQIPIGLQFKHELIKKVNT